MGQNLSKVSSVDNGINIIMTEVAGVAYSSDSSTYFLSYGSNPKLSRLTAQEKIELQNRIKTGISAENAYVSNKVELKSTVDSIVNDFIFTIDNIPAYNTNLLETIAIAAGADTTPTPFSRSGFADHSLTNKPVDPNKRASLPPVNNVREAESVKRATFLDLQKNAIAERGGSLVDTITGADLSVFFLTELPNIEDLVAVPPVPFHLQRKELLLLEIDSVLSASYSIMREVFPVRSVGQMKPKSFVRGPVTISGHLAFTIFTEDVLVRLRTQMQKSIIKAQEKASAVMTSYKNQTASMTSNIYSTSTARELESASLKNLQETYTLYNTMLNTGGIFMLNQLLPFHILMMGTTERGIFSKMMIKNIRVIDENQLQGVQQPNIVNRISFIAEDIFPLMSGRLNADMAYADSANVDQSNISTSKYAIYKGSQVMNDIASMASGEYRLQ